MTSLLALLCMYGFNYFCGTLSVTFYHTASAADMTTVSTDGTLVVRQVLNKGPKVLLLESFYRLGVISYFHVQRDQR